MVSPLAGKVSQKSFSLRNHHIQHKYVLTQNIIVLSSSRSEYKRWFRDKYYSSYQSRSSKQLKYATLLLNKVQEYNQICKRYQSHVYLNTLYIVIDAKDTKVMLLGHPVNSYRCKRYQSHGIGTPCNLYIVIDVKVTKALVIETPCIQL